MASHLKNSSIITGGWPYGASLLGRSFQSTTDAADRSTIASCAAPEARSKTTKKARREISALDFNSAFEGSTRCTIANRWEGPSRLSRRNISQAELISSSDKGSSGWRRESNCRTDASCAEPVIAIRNTSPEDCPTRSIGTTKNPAQGAGAPQACSVRASQPAQYLIAPCGVSGHQPSGGLHSRPAGPQHRLSSQTFRRDTLPRSVCLS